MSDIDAKLERSATGNATGVSSSAEADEIDIALDGLEEVEAPVPLPAPREKEAEREIDVALDALGDRALGALEPVALPAPRARQAEHEIDVALGALGDEPSPSMVMEVDRALGALEPVPSSVMPAPVEPVEQEIELALGALGEAPAPSVVVELPEAAVAAEPAPAADEAERALDALGEAPAPSVVVEVPEAAAGAPGPVPSAAADEALAGEDPAPVSAVEALQAAASASPDVPGTGDVQATEHADNTGEPQVAAEPVITSSESGTHGAEDMGAAQQQQQVEVGHGGGISPTPELLRSLVPGMVRAAAAILGAADPDLDDVVQQSLIGFVHALPSFRGECGPARFASRIVARTACAARRRRALQASRRVDEVDVDALEAVSPSQSAELMAERRRSALRELLADIPEEQAETLSLRVVFGFSLEEVAETTGVPVNTVRSRVRLAKEALRSRIDERPALRELLEVES